MPFNQLSLDRSVNTSRDIFDKYIYKTNDTIAEVAAPSYFARSRYRLSPQWIGSLMDIQAIDGYALGKILSGGTVEIITSGVTPPPTVQNAISATSTSRQEPTGLDIPLQIEFGAPQETPLISLDASGTMVFKESGFYDGRVLFSVSRDRNNAVAYIYIRGLINDVQVSPPILAEIDNNEFTVPLSFAFAVFFEQGTTLKFEMIRDDQTGDGFDDGSLNSFTSTNGWGASASASITMNKLS